MNPFEMQQPSTSNAQTQTSSKFSTNAFLNPKANIEYKLGKAVNDYFANQRAKSSEDLFNKFVTPKMQATNYPAGISKLSPAQQWPTQFSGATKSIAAEPEKVKPAAAETPSNPGKFLDPVSIAGIGISSLNDSISKGIINNNLNKARLGAGPEGHGFDAQNIADRQANYDSTISNIRSGEIAVGAAFGPEGLAAGTLAAGVTTGISHFFEPSPDVTNLTSGGQGNTSMLN